MSPARLLGQLLGALTGTIGTAGLVLAVAAIGLVIGVAR